MHALPSYPRHPLLLGALIVLLALLVVGATAPDLGSLDFSIGGGAPAAEPAAPPAAGSGEASWVADPLAPPLEHLSGAR